MRVTQEEFNAMGNAEQIARLERLGRAALEQFGVQPDAVTPLVHMENTTFRVDSAQGAFNLRISRPGYQSHANVRSEIVWLGALRRAGHRVPEPYLDRVVTAEVPDVPEARDVVLLRWMGGEFRREGLSPEEAAAVGRTMAGLHEFTAQWPIPEGFDRQTLQADAWEPRRPSPIDSPTPLLSESDRELLRRVDDEFRSIYPSQPRTPDRYGLIHADMHLSNVLFEGGEVNVIDFDDTGYGFLIYDLAAALAFHGTRADRRETREAMLAGYQAIRPLPPDTDELLDAFLRIRLSGICHWVINRQDNPRMREEGPRFIAWLCEGIRGWGG